MSRYAVRLFSGGALALDTRFGDVRVEGWDEPRVQVEAEKVVRAGSEARAAPLFERIRIEMEGEDREVSLRVIFPPRKLWRPFRGESKLAVNFRIRMPYDANLRLRCVDGDVRVIGLKGREELQVNYGDVEINVPDVYRLRALDARAWMGYVQSDLGGLTQDSAGFRQRVAFWNGQGEQDIRVKVRMGGVFIYSSGE